MMRIDSQVPSVTYRLLVIFMAFCLILALLPTRLVFAAGDKLFFTPPSQTNNIGDTITVSVKSYTQAQQTNGTASGTVNYPSNILQVIDTTNNGSNYGSPSVSVNNSSISFSGTNANAASGIQLIFTIHFKAVGSGVASVTFGGGSLLNGSTTAYDSATYTINNPSPVVSSQPIVTPKPTPSNTPAAIITTPAQTPSPSATPDADGPTPDPTGLVDTVVVSPLYSSATITWRVNGSGSSSSIAYGNSSVKLDKTGTVTKQGDNAYTTSISGLTPGQKYYFSITGNADGGKTGNYSQTIYMRGFPVLLSVTENNVPAKNAQVKIGTGSWTTSSDGKLSIGLAAGTYSMAVTTDTASLTQDITVAAKTIPTDGSAPESQSFSAALSSSALAQGPGSGSTILAFIGALFGGAAVLGVGFVGFTAYRRRQYELGGSAGGTSHASSTVIIEDGYDWQHDLPDTDPSNDKTAQAPVLGADPTHGYPSEKDKFADIEQPEDMFDKAEHSTLPTPKA